MLMDASFDNRYAAGQLLAVAVARLELNDPLVLALPRGGVPVAAAVAKALNAPLELLIVRKIGAPGQPEVAVAAVAEGEASPVVNVETMSFSGALAEYIDREAVAQMQEIEHRCRTYRSARPPLSLTGRTVVVVDDGIATGTSMRAALLALRHAAPAQVVLAVPVAPADSLADLRPLVDQVVCLMQPQFFHSVGEYYRDFRQVEDAEVIALMQAQQASQAHGR
jgi:predicted phosphoribosyltransferase